MPQEVYEPFRPLEQAELYKGASPTGCRQRNRTEPV